MNEEEMLASQQADEAPAAPEPQDLASAMLAYRAANQPPAQDPVAAEGADGDVQPGGAGEAGPADEPAGEPAAVPEPDEPGDGDGDGGYATGIEAIDFDAQKQSMLRDIQRRSRADVAREFAENNIGKYSITELRIEDERTGNVLYRNPDVRDERDPNYYFKSRSEAQSFVDSWNKGVDYEYQKAVNEKQREMVNDILPTVRMIDFMPKWKAMDDATKQVFDALLEGHEVRDSSGKEVGFDVDLDAVAAQAVRIAALNRPQQQAPAQKAQPQQRQQQQQQQPTGPALDMRTGGGQAADEEMPAADDLAGWIRWTDRKNRKGK